MNLLIVEDEEKIQKALARGFSEEGYKVFTASDGEEAINSIEGQSLDCIILDLMLPKLDGQEIIRRTRLKHNTVPILILTAKDSLKEKVKGLEEGADDYLAKPFSFEELLARVKALIRRSTQGETVLKAGSLTLDPFKKVVKRAGQTLTITGKDYYILEYLMKHKGSVISESMILQRIWYDEDHTSNLVAAHIKLLRNKIDKAFPEEKPVIQTLRGLGYKIDG